MPINERRNETFWISRARRTKPAIPRTISSEFEEDRIPVRQIGSKYFIVLRDLEAWKSTRGEARLEETIQQLDGWLKQRVQASAEPIAELDDKE